MLAIEEALERSEAPQAMAVNSWAAEHLSSKLKPNRQSSIVNALPVILLMNDMMRISDNNGEYIFNIELK